jgi:hypothetical protein
MQVSVKAFALCLLTLTVLAAGQGLAPYVTTYGSTYCSSGIPQGPFPLSSCVPIGATVSIGGDGVATCSQDGDFVFYNLYNSSAACTGAATPVKAGATSCQGGGAVQWYSPYCDSASAVKKAVPLV